MAKTYKYLSAALVAAALAACGGGGGSASMGTSGNALTDLANTPTGTTTTPTSANYTLTDNTGATSTQVAALAGTGASASIAFSSLGFTLTGADTSNPSWSNAGGGAVRASGKYLAYCSAGQGGTSNGVKEGTRVLIASEATAVTNANEIKGLTFSAFNCASDAQTYAFSTDGSFTISGNGSTATLPAEALTQYLSDAGYGAFFSTSKFRVFKLAINGTTRYAIVSLVVNAGSPASRQVAILFQN